MRLSASLRMMADMRVGRERGPAVCDIRMMAREGRACACVFVVVCVAGGSAERYSPNGRDCPGGMAAGACHPGLGVGWHGGGDALDVVLLEALTKDDLQLQQRRKFDEVGGELQ